MSHPPPPKPPSLSLVPRDASTVATPVVGNVSADERAAAEALFKNARAERSFKEFHGDWEIFSRWCAANGHSALPAAADVVALFVVHMHREGLKLSTVQRRLSTVRQKHKLSNLPVPESQSISLAVAGVARTRGRQKEKKDPLMEDDLLKLIAPIPKTIGGDRERAILLLGYAGAFRSAELAALTTRDIEQTDGGILIHVRKSKTDQTWKGFTKPIAKRDDALCPVSALGKWLHRADIHDGPLFRPLHKHGGTIYRHMTPQVVTTIVKEACVRAGIEPEKFASHSLRAGHVTQRLNDGDDPLTIMGVTGHTSVEMLKEYDRRKAKNPMSVALRPKDRK